MKDKKTKKQILYPNYGAVIVATPGDETLWAGGVLLLHPETKWSIVSLCGKSEPESEKKFAKALKELGTSGQMGNFEAGAGRTPPSGYKIQKTILSLLFSERFDVIITPSLWPEGGQDIMSKLAAKSILALTRTGRLIAKQIWQFAYEKNRHDSSIVPAREADIYIGLAEDIRQKKYDILTNVYGYTAEDIKTKTAPNDESFWVLGKKLVKNG